MYVYLNNLCNALEHMEYMVHDALCEQMKSNANMHKLNIIELATSGQPAFQKLT